MAVRLLIESTRPDVVARISWKEAVVDAYVDSECVELAKSSAKAFDGSRIEREMVVIELYESVGYTYRSHATGGDPVDVAARRRTSA